ncbi:hypothetical protein CBL_03089 [Carabus blaptoides fortunei]
MWEKPKFKQGAEGCSGARDNNHWTPPWGVDNWSNAVPPPRFRRNLPNPGFFPELYRFLLLMESSAGTIAVLPDLPVSNPTTTTNTLFPPIFHNRNSNILMDPLKVERGPFSSNYLPVVIQDKRVAISEILHQDWIHDEPIKLNEGLSSVPAGKVTAKALSGLHLSTVTPNKYYRIPT